MQFFHALAALAVVLATSVQSSETPQQSTIRGRVVDHDAKGLDGATVFVYTAAPRVGTSSL